MLSKTKFFLLLFVLYCPPSLLIPLAQQDVSTTSKADNLVVLGSNQIEQVTPNNSNVAEIIQQIDVKDDENHVISNINHVVISDENSQNDNNETQDNGTNNVVVNNVLEQTGDVSSVLNTTGVTNPLNDSSSLLLTSSLTGSSYNPLNADNITVKGLQNKLANETQTNPLNTTNNSNVKNGPIQEVGTVQNGSTTKVNVSSTIIPYISGGTTSNYIEETGVPTLETIDGENTLHESLNDTEVELAWRSDIPVRKNKTKNLKHIAQLDSQKATLLANNINGNINNNNSDLLDSENDKEKSISVILNSGNIDGLSVNSSANSGNLQTNLENNAIENINSSSSKLLNDLINFTINDVLSNILKQNHSNLNSIQRIFLLLNSSSISNVHVSSVLENIFKNTISKTRSRRDLNEPNTNNTDIESKTLKPETDKSNNIIDVKFRTGEHQGTQNNVTKENYVSTVPLVIKQNNTNLGSNAPDNATLANSIEVPIEDISSGEVPAFRFLIPDKIRKLQVSNVVNSELNETKYHNLVPKLSPESSPISTALNQIPLNDLFGGAFSIIKRLKRSTLVNAENIYPWKRNCKSKQIDEHQIVYCKKPKLNDNDLTIPTIKSLDDTKSNVLKPYDSVELNCLLSAIIKLYSYRVLDKISKNYPDSVLNNVLSSLVNGNEDVINLVSKELSDLPVPVKIRLQLLHGKTKEFMEQLSHVVNAKLCSLS